MCKQILILGGSGNTGEKIARLLLDHSDIQIVLAARNETKLKQISKKLNYPDRIKWTTVDASNKDLLTNAFVDIDIVVSAASTAQYTENIARACIAIKCDYLDVQYSSEKVRILKSMKAEIEASSLCFISEAGLHPGLPSALVRYANSQLDELESAVTYAAINTDMNSIELSDATQQEFIRELQNYDALFFHNDQWKKASMWTTRDFRKIEFGEPAGTKMCAPMFLEELRDLPKQIPTMNNTGFYIAGFGWFLDMVVMPFVILMMKIFPNMMAKPMGNLFVWAWKISSKPPYYVIVRLEAFGVNNGKPTQIKTRLFHEDGYWFTAIPVVACLLQVLDGSIRKPGLHWMGQIVDPNRLMNDMEKMGIEIN